MVTFLLVKRQQGAPSIQDGDLGCRVVRTEAAGQQEVACGFLCSRLELWLQEAREVGILVAPVRITRGQGQSVGSWVHGGADAGAPAFVLLGAHAVQWWEEAGLSQVSGIHVRSFEGRVSIL